MKNFLKKVGRILFFFTYIFFVASSVGLASLFIIKNNDAFFQDLLLVFLKIVIVTILSMPFIWYLNRQIRFSEEVALILKAILNSLFLGNMNKTHI